MPTKPRPPNDPTSLEPLKDLMRRASVYPAEAYVAALKRLEELTDNGVKTENEVKDSAHCARVMAICLATYRAMPEIFESNLAFPPMAYMQSNESGHSRPDQMKPLAGSKQPNTDYKRAPRPGDA